MIKMYQHTVVGVNAVTSPERRPGLIISSYINELKIWILFISEIGSVEDMRFFDTEEEAKNHRVLRGLPDINNINLKKLEKLHGDITKIQEEADLAVMQGLMGNKPTKSP